MNKPLSLSDRQLELLKNAARAVPPRQREEFLQKVANHLGPEPSDHAVQAAVNRQLDLLPTFEIINGRLCLRDGCTYKVPRIVTLVPSLTLTATAPIIGAALITKQELNK
jgi:hypothetical protein